MEADSWNAHFSVTSSRRYRSRSGTFPTISLLFEMLVWFWKFPGKWALCIGELGAGLYQGDHEEIEDENSRAEFLCPFCAEDFDIVGLYCHVDEEHPVEVKNAVRRFANFFIFNTDLADL